MATEVMMENMTWTEIRQAIESGSDTAIVITGSIEQHGPHLPTGTDTILGYAVGVRVAEKLGNALLAPVVRPGLSEHHMAFSGSITLSPETFEGVVRDYVRSLARHGFRRVILLWSHGGNAPTVKSLAPQLAAVMPEIEIWYEADMTRMFHALMAVASRDGIDLETVGIHAGEMETSVMRSYVPDQVRLDEADLGFMGDLINSREEQKRLHEEGLYRLTTNGILGDARVSEPGRGELYLDAWVSYIVDNLVQA